jgi:small multidrug resistance family-3 protein
MRLLTRAESDHDRIRLLLDADLSSLRQQLPPLQPLPTLTRIQRAGKRQPSALLVVHRFAVVVPRRRGHIVAVMTALGSVLLFILAAAAEIGGAWLVWQGVRAQRGLGFIAAGVVVLGLYGFVATFQPDPHFGRILAAYGGVFVAGSLAWGLAVDGFRPDRYDLTGALLCLLGVAVIMYTPRTG